VPVGAAWKPDAVSAPVASQFIDVSSQRCASGDWKRRASRCSTTEVNLNRKTGRGGWGRGSEDGLVRQDEDDCSAFVEQEPQYNMMSFGALIGTTL
jgi:hypothetical protein